MHLAPALNVPGKSVRQVLFYGPCLVRSSPSYDQFPMLMETFPVRICFIEHRSIKANTISSAVLSHFPAWMAPWNRDMPRRKASRGSFYYYLAQEAARACSLSDFEEINLIHPSRRSPLMPASLGSCSNSKSLTRSTDEEVSGLAGNLFGGPSPTAPDRTTLNIFSTYSWKRHDEQYPYLPHSWSLRLSRSLRESMGGAQDRRRRGP
jgi:hypothetical protein